MLMLYSLVYMPTEDHYSVSLLGVQLLRRGSVLSKLIEVMKHYIMYYSYNIVRNGVLPRFDVQSS
jgi:hypothetical protein